MLGSMEGVGRDRAVGSALGSLPALSGVSLPARVVARRATGVQYRIVKRGMDIALSLVAFGFICSSADTYCGFDLV